MHRVIINNAYGGVSLKKFKGISINDVLNTEYMRSSRWLCMNDGDKSLVKKVVIIADPTQVDQCATGDFVLTTSYFISTLSDKQQTALLQNLANKHISLLGIQGENWFSKDGMKFVQLLDIYPLSVLAIASDINLSKIFVSISNKISEDIQDYLVMESTSVVKNSSVESNPVISINMLEELYKKNMKIISNGGGINNILVEIGNTLGNQIFLKDYHFNQCRSVRVINIPKIKSLFEFMLEDVNSIKAEDLKNDDIMNSNIMTVSINGMDMDRIAVPVIINNNIYGHLIMYGVFHKINELEVMSLTILSNLISMDMLKKISSFEFANKHKENFFLNLISSHESCRRKAIGMVADFNLEIYSRYSVVTIEYQKQEFENRATDVYNALMVQSTYMIDLICNRAHNNVIVIKNGYQINILFMWKRADDYKAIIEKITDDIQNMMYNKTYKLPYNIGIGRVYDSIDKVLRSYMDSKRALCAAQTYCNELVVDFDELGIYKLLCHEDLYDELIAFYDETLKPLVVYDRRRDTELIKSLIYYFEMNGNLKKMSEKLFTHYNTVLYRVNRIQEITGKNLDDEEDRYGLHTALKIMKMLDL